MNQPQQHQAQEYASIRALPAHAADSAPWQPLLLVAFALMSVAGSSVVAGLLMN